VLCDYQQLSAGVESRGIARIDNVVFLLYTQMMKDVYHTGNFTIGLTVDDDASLIKAYQFGNVCLNQTSWEFPPFMGM